MQLELFHGTRQRFAQFDTSFKGSAEAGGDIDACWFTDNFNGARNHALFHNRRAEVPLVYRCELTSEAIIADHSKSLNEQPDIEARLRRYLPDAIKGSLKSDRNWHAFSVPIYEMYKGERVKNYRSISSEEQIVLYRSCGIHGVYDWEGEHTDSYLRGTVTVIFDCSVLVIREVLEITPAGKIA